MSSGTASDPIVPLESHIAHQPLRSAHEESGVSSADFRLRFTVADLTRLYDLGFVEDDQRFELVDGDLIPMSRPLPPHASCINRLNRIFSHGLGDRVSLLVQNPIFLGDTSQPQPDLTLATFREDGYEDGHPTPENIFLVVEVMDSTHRMDRGVKKPLYAKAGIRETWLIDLPGEMLEVHRKPMNGMYTENLIFVRGQTVTPEAFPDLVLAVESILRRSGSLT